MVACMGTINLESDSVRKYTEGKHTSVARQDKSAADDKKPATEQTEAEHAQATLCGWMLWYCR